MRYYKLSITGAPPIGSGLEKSGQSGKLVFSSEATTSGFLGLKSVNPTPLQIEFSVHSYSEVSASVPATIKLHNLPIDLYQSLQAWSKQKPKVILEAGWNDKYVMSDALGYKPITNQQILAGNVQNVLGNFEPLNNYVIISTALATPLNEMREFAAQQAGKQVDEIEAQFDANKSIKDNVEKYVKMVIADGWKIVLSNGLKSFINSNRQAVVFKFINWETLIAQLAINFAVSFFIDAASAIIKLFINADSPAIPKDQKDKYKDDKFSGDNSSSITITSADLLAQPQASGYSNELNIITRMRADIKLGSTIKVGKSLTSLGAGLQTATFTSEGIYDLNIINAGTYRVIDLIHSGNFYGTTADSWSTQMRVVPLTGSVK